MKFLSFCLIVSVLAAPAFGKALKCQASDSSNSAASRVKIPVTVVEGALTSETIKTPYAGYTISVIHQVGDRSEPQTMLRITNGEVSAQSYNLSENGLYQLIAKNLFVQCWFE